MSSLDDYEDCESRSESEDDMSEEAVYKRSRLRTRSPSVVTSPPGSDIGEQDEEAMTVRATSEEDKKQEALRLQRLAVIRVLVSRANELYRAQLARKAQNPAVTRVKEEIVD